ncbi:class F sortase [Planotetraspora sp. A-T 1434]|uniref:class F sortase n=1 Tax=Planotetraspora sp. A-T 1434 TaxID=2979219 RepID=UPI0021C142F7|nr:class F sortase [Planotetraspora sp. A-T 1434]MCT9931897.1 class F sortase [Planotetraspora sp. A-T 1434]
MLRGRPVALVLGGLVTALSACAGGAAPAGRTADVATARPPAEATAPSSPEPAVTPAATAAGVVPLPASIPVRLTIDKIGVETPLLKLGLNPDRTLETPSMANVMKAGWYTGGPTPGQNGTSVLVGHVDSRNGPAVFYRLRDLRPGDAVKVTRKDGSTAVFTVYKREQVPKNRFPTQRVYRQATRPELRLITCGGGFDRSIGHYVDNLIVYARLTGSA